MVLFQLSERNQSFEENFYDEHAVNVQQKLDLVEDTSYMQSQLFNCSKE